MMTNRFVAGVVAGLAISVVGLIYSLVRKDKMVGLFMRGGEGEPAMSASAASLILFGSMLFMGPFLGMLAALMSIGVIVGQTPRMGAKIVMNYLLPSSSAYGRDA